MLTLFCLWMCFVLSCISFIFISSLHCAFWVWSYVCKVHCNCIMCFNTSLWWFSLLQETFIKLSRVIFWLDLCHLHESFATMVIYGFGMACTYILQCILCRPKQPLSIHPAAVGRHIFKGLSKIFTMILSPLMCKFYSIPIVVWSRPTAFFSKWNNYIHT